MSIELILLVISAANFIFWFDFGRHNKDYFTRYFVITTSPTDVCPEVKQDVMEEPCPGRFFDSKFICKGENIVPIQDFPQITKVDAAEFDQYRSPYLGPFRFEQSKAFVINFDTSSRDCHRYANIYATRGDRKVNAWTSGQQYCVAAVRVQGKSEIATHSLYRFDSNVKFNSSHPDTGSNRPTGFPFQRKQYKQVSYAH